jgi:tRNA-dihydrouridine synthase
MKFTPEEAWRWWRSMGSPRSVCAPMVLQSELAFRMLVRQHGCSLCYTPMIPVGAFLACAADGVAEHPLTGGPNTQAVWFTTHSADRPFVRKA